MITPDYVNLLLDAVNLDSLLILFMFLVIYDLFHLLIFQIPSICVLLLSIYFLSHEFYYLIH